jgi:hypothetical protein
MGPNDNSRSFGSFYPHRLSFVDCVVVVVHKYTKTMISMIEITKEKKTHHYRAQMTFKSSPPPVVC